MRRSSVPILIVCALALAGLGCGAKKDRVVAEPGAAQWATTTPAAKGALAKVTWDLPYGEPSSLDWLHAAAYSENTVLANLCESLLRPRPDLRPEPALARSVANPVPTRWVYRLRRGVRFTDGRPMTAGDVVFSLRRNLDLEQGSFWTTWFANVRDIRATGPDTVTVTLAHADPLFNQFMATAAGVVAERRYVERAGAAYGTPKGGVMCTGPYALRSWTPGTAIRTVRNDRYWDTAHRPKVTRIDYVFVTNPTTLAAALRAGDIDGTYEAPVAALHTLRASDAGTLMLGRSLEFANLLFTSRPGPIQDVRVRHALAVALDRHAIASTIFQGAAVALKSTSFPASWGYGQAIYRRAYDALPDTTRPDLATARSLLKAAGPQRTLRAAVNADEAASTQLGAYVQSVGRRLGLRVKVTALPTAQLIATLFDPRRQRQYDLLLNTANYDDVPEPLELAVLGLKAGGPYNVLGQADPVVQRLLARAERTTDPAARARLLVAIQSQSGKHWVTVPLVNYAERLFMNRRVTGAPASMTTYLYRPWGADLGAAR